MIEHAKKITITFWFVFLLLSACTVDKKQTTEVTTTIEKAPINNKEDSIKALRRQLYQKERKEANVLNRKGREEEEQAVVTKEKTKKFPDCSYTKVHLYKLNGNGNHSGVASVFRQRTSQFKVLKLSDVKPFLDLINAKKSYGNTTAACHEPRIGLVFYQEEVPCAYLSLCLACNNMYTNPELDFGLQSGMESGFSIESRKKLHQIFAAWGFPDEEYSPLFDDAELYAIFLRKQGLSEEDIKEAIREQEESLNE